MEKRFFLEDNLLYTIPKEKYNKDDLSKIFEEHKEIKFVSFVGIDLWGNDTDEKIPVKYFLDNLMYSLSTIILSHILSKK